MSVTYVLHSSSTGMIQDSRMQKPKIKSLVFIWLTLTEACTERQKHSDSRTETVRHLQKDSHTETVRQGQTY